MHIYTEHVVVLLVLFFFSPTPLAIRRDMQRVHGTMKTSPCLADHTFRDDTPLKVIANDVGKKKKKESGFV
uniref:Putative secreted protein n=1 Tax=Ixodes ricinus TaxID=34613 RepID=A0A6B0U1W1_IXORI